MSITQDPSFSLENTLSKKQAQNEQKFLSDRN